MLRFQEILNVTGKAFAERSLLQRNQELLE